MTVGSLRRRVAAALVPALALSGMVASCAGSEADVGAFCGTIESLRAEDPFAELLIASPGEMRDAFGRLATAAAALDRTAPDEAGVQAGRYRRSVDDLVDELSGAGFDPTRLDGLRYQDRVEAYGAAAASLDRAAQAACDPGSSD